MQHPNEVYYHEALVQLQRQVLYRIKDAGELLEELEPAQVKAETGDPDSNEVAETSRKDSLKLKTNEQVLSWNGLDRSEPKEGEGDKRSKKEKRKEERIARNSSDEPLKEAVMTIDSSLISTPLDEEEAGGDADIFQRRDRSEVERKKQLKMLTDLAQIPYEPYRQELIRNARNATRVSLQADSSSHYLRLMLVDTLSPDKGLSEEAKEAYENALDEINNNQIPEAAKLLEKAIALHPTFYAAHLKLGDTYYLMNRDTAASNKYRQAFLLQPNLPDPLVRLSMVQYNSGRYTEAGALILEAILIYPEHQYWTLLKRILSKTGKEFNPQWIPREVYPLSTRQNYEDIIAREKTPWWHYQSAKGEVYSYYDTAGLVRPNEKTTEPYLEVYGWKWMLNRSGLFQFPFARVMDELGYLDCYVLVSLFHQDLYGQFADLVKREPEKVRKYLYLVMNWEDKKFEKLREKVKSLEKSVGTKKEAEPASGSKTEPKEGTSKETK